MMNNNRQEYNFTIILLLLCNKPFHFCSKNTHTTFLLINFSNKRHVKATITRSDLSPRFFLLMLRYCANLKAIRYESSSLNRIAADKSHRVIVA